MRKGFIIPDEKGLSIEEQCELVGLSRSSYYYEPCEENESLLIIMREIDKIYTAHPEKGKRRISEDLKALGYDVGIDLARSLMRKMGIQAQYPRPNLSRRNHEHKVYPYLLRGVEIEKCDQVWSTDITYVPVRNGFLYLTAVIDWYSRYVLAWEISNTLDGSFCRNVLLRSLEKGKPEIFNTDQGCQYTCKEFISILLEHEIAISMDGKGRALDNVFVERLWRTVKWEDIYLKDYETAKELYSGMKSYFPYYNEERKHSSLGYETPFTVYSRR
jgi:putative transposase